MNLCHTLTILLIVFLAPVKAFDKVIYGDDDRSEILNSPYSHLAESIGAMVDLSEIEVNETYKEFLFEGFETLKEYRGIKTCDDVRFRRQTRAAKCTGFLIGKRTLITAGHCITKYDVKLKNTRNEKCKNLKWIFNFNHFNSNSGSILVEKTKVASCHKIIKAQYDYNLDYAIIELNKEFNGSKLKLNTSGKTDDIEKAITVIGHPSGLPLKVASGAKIKYANEYNFTANLDAFQGNSGSPILDENNSVIGILNSGEKDFYFNRDDLCYAENHCEKVDGECNEATFGIAVGETATKMSAIKKDLEPYLR